MSAEVRSTRLRQVGLTPTAQRLAVLGYLEENRTHPTAEEVYCGVRDGLPSLTKATVYNVLDALKKADLIQELTIARKAAQYDYNPVFHPHFLCRVCGSLYDIDVPSPIRTGDTIRGHLVEAVQTYFYGVCAHCHPDADKNGSKRKERENA